ncbi:dehydrogenase [Streptomyces cadmiisoli]|uniref:Dehydrogenase n=1 Tax=Streptomyces cadmiisoli TaxID=2184053 RepID=A0A2Z4JEI4_9ACTN|nr:dehydrogenase [Streptomyces cadmiisoli]
MTSGFRECPECGRPMRPGGLVLARREDDGRRMCRSLWACASRHVWWKWVDAPSEPFEICPWLQLFR